MAWPSHSRLRHRIRPRYPRRGGAAPSSRSGDLVRGSRLIESHHRSARDPRLRRIRVPAAWNDGQTRRNAPSFIEHTRPLGLIVNVEDRITGSIRYSYDPCEHVVYADRAVRTSGLRMTRLATFNQGMPLSTAECGTTLTSICRAAGSSGEEISNTNTMPRGVWRVVSNRRQRQGLRVNGRLNGIRSTSLGSSCALTGKDGATNMMRCRDASPSGRVTKRRLSGALIHLFMSSRTRVEGLAV